MEHDRDPFIQGYRKRLFQLQIVALSLFIFAVLLAIAGQVIEYTSR